MAAPRSAVPVRADADAQRGLDGFLAHLANNRIGKLLAGFNTAAWQSVKVERRLACAPHD